MGGHTQFGEYYIIDAAVRAYKGYVSEFVGEMYLCLRYAEIRYNDETKKFTLAMRFSK